MGFSEVSNGHRSDKYILNNSFSFAVFICLQCAGTHRGFGVHIRLAFKIPTNLRYVVYLAIHLVSCGLFRWTPGKTNRSNACRYVPGCTSCNLDFQPPQLQLGGNLPFKEFMKSYKPADQGGYKEGASPYDTYHCWAAAQYRERVFIPFPHPACYQRVLPSLYSVGCNVSWT